MPGFLRIHGDKGALELAPAYNYDGVHLVSLGGDYVDITSQGDSVMHFVLEAEHFANCIRTGATPRTPGEEGLHDMLAIEAIYKAAGTPIA
jgi:predicted dehydrogenase